MKRAAFAILAALFVAGCTSTVVLGTLVDGGPPIDIALPRSYDLADGGGILGDFGPDGFDGAVLVDLAQ